MSDSDLISVGEIVGVFGVKGWVKVFSSTDPRENIISYSPWTLKKGNEVKEVKLINGKRQGKSVVALIDGISERNDAELLCGWEILVNRNQLPETEDGVYYWRDLVGLSVETVQGVSLGNVDSLLETGANDVLIVKDGEQERLIPFLHKQVIKRVDFNDRRIIVDWDPDL